MLKHLFLALTSVALIAGALPSASAMTSAGVVCHTNPYLDLPSQSCARLIIEDAGPECTTESSGYFACTNQFTATFVLPAGTCALFRTAIYSFGSSGTGSVRAYACHSASTPYATDPETHTHTWSMSKNGYNLDPLALDPDWDSRHPSYPLEITFCVWSVWGDGGVCEASASWRHYSTGSNPATPLYYEPLAPKAPVGAGLETP